MYICVAMLNKTPPPPMGREFTQLVESIILEQIQKFLATVGFTQNVNIEIPYYETVRLLGISDKSLSKSLSNWCTEFFGLLYTERKTIRTVLSTQGDTTTI